MYIGQRVKLVRPINPKYQGIEGTIESFEEWSAGTFCRDGLILPIDTDCVVQWDDFPNARNQAKWQLEPIQPSGWEKITWDQCEWWSWIVSPDTIEEKV